MDISSLVRAVIGAFEDSSKLVQRIREQRDRDTQSELEDGKTKADRLPAKSTRELLDSLALGPVIVRGHYEHDLKRFGEQYACGDIQAREQMKDVLISLQLTLINTLRSVYMDGIDLDFQVLLTASDDSRVNAAVCLGQLSQRLSDAAKAQAYYPLSISSSSYSSPAARGLMPPMSPSLGYSSSRSTQSSASAAFMGPRTPDPEQLDNVGLTVTRANGKRLGLESADGKCGGEQQSNLWASLALPFESRVTEALPLPLGGHHQGNQRNLPLSVLSDDSDAVSLRRRSSQALAADDNILLLFPEPGGRPHVSSSSAPCSSETDPNRNEKTVVHRYSSSSSTAGSGHTYHSSSPDVPHANRTTRNSRDRYGPDDYGEHVHQQQQHGYDQHRRVESPGFSDAAAAAAAYRTDGRQYSHSTIYDMYQPQQPLTPEKQVVGKLSQQRPLFSSAADASPSPYVQRADNVTVPIQHGDARECERVRQLQETSRPPRPQQQPRSDSLNALRNPETRVDDQNRRAGVRPVRFGHVLGGGRGTGARQHSAAVGTHPAAIGPHGELQSHPHPLPLFVPAERQPREPPCVPLPLPPTQVQPPRQQYKFMPHSSTTITQKQQQQQQHQTQQQQQQQKSNNTTMSDSKSHSRPTSTSTPTTTSTTTPRPLPPAQRPGPSSSSSSFSPATDTTTTGNNLLLSTSTAPQSSTISNSNSKCLSLSPPISTSISTPIPVSGPISLPIPIPIHIPLTLPTDQDLLGFCKGAFRLQAGMERKAFGLANRPSGLSGMITYWKCEKCNFEGPAPARAATGTGNQKKKSKQNPQRTFDPKIRVSDGGGVRYKWAFLARCHVAVKALPQASVTTTASSGGGGGGGGGLGRASNDIFGSFGCIFCCAEGKSRGWLGHKNSSEDSEGVVGGGSTPIFGNVGSFMHHLETVHVNRGPDGWPCPEMVGRFRVVFGHGYRDAEGSSGEWEVNFVPSPGSSSSLPRS